LPVEPAFFVIILGFNIFRVRFSFIWHLSRSMRHPTDLIGGGHLGWRPSPGRGSRLDSMKTRGDAIAGRLTTLAVLRGT
jgi:hypothetical protein